MKKENNPSSDACGHVVNMNWLRQAGAAGFAFFLVKGLAWIVAVVWLAY